MDNDLNQIIHLLESFTSENNEKRFESEQQYQYLEQSSPETVISILFRIIDSNISINSSQQALIRLHFFLKSMSSSTPRISIDVANSIKKFLLDFIVKTTDSNLANHAFFIVLDYFIRSPSDEKALNEFAQYLIDLYKVQPLISLSSLTLLFDTYPNLELVNHICSFMNLNPESELLFYQSIISGLTLIKHDINFENRDKFISNLPAMFSSIPDVALSKPLNAFDCAFLINRAPFLPCISDLFLFILNAANNPEHEEGIRVQCFNMFNNFASKSKEFRDLAISNPKILLGTIANSISQPHQYEDIYKEGKKCLKYILLVLADQTDVFNNYIKELGMSDNIYIQSVFLFYIPSNFSLDFAFKNIYHVDSIVRKNCLKIIIRSITKGYEYKLASEDGKSLRDLIEEKVVDIFVHYLNNQNFEIFKLFVNWCECNGSQSFYKCIGPVIALLNNNCDNEKLLIMASLLCKIYYNYPEMETVTLNLLGLAKNGIVEQPENEIFVHIVGNLISLLNRESKIAYLNEILPGLFNSITLAVSLPFVSIIEEIKEDFIPFLQAYLEILFNLDEKVNIEKITSHQIELSDSDLQNLSYMLQSFTSIITIFGLSDIQNNENIYNKIIMIIIKYFSFPINEIQYDSIDLYARFIQIFDTPTNDVILYFIEPVYNMIKNTTDIESLCILASTSYSMTSKNKYAKYIANLVSLIFQQIMKVIQKVLKEDGYFDGYDEDIINQTLQNLFDSYEELFDLDDDLAILTFYKITKIVPYFTLPGIGQAIKIFIASVWTDFLSFADPKYLPAQRPNILNDLFQFYSISDDITIKKRIVDLIGILVFNYSPDLSSSILIEFEKIIGNENEDCLVKQNAVFQYANLLLKCDQETYDSKVPNFLNMVSLFYSNPDNLGCYCDKLIVLDKRSNGSLGAQNIIPAFVEQELLDEDDINCIIEEIGDFQPFQPLAQFLESKLPKNQQTDE